MGKKIEGLETGLAVSAWWLVSAPVDFRCGADRLLVHVREVLGRDPLDGSAYVCCNRRTSRIKVLVVDGQGAWLSMRRLHQAVCLAVGERDAVVAHAQLVRVAVRRGRLAAFVM